MASMRRARQRQGQSASKEFLAFQAVRKCCCVFSGVTFGGLSSMVTLGAGRMLTNAESPPAFLPPPSANLVLSLTTSLERCRGRMCRVRGWRGTAKIASLLKSNAVHQRQRVDPHDCGPRCNRWSSVLKERESPRDLARVVEVVFTKLEFFLFLNLVIFLLDVFLTRQRCHDTTRRVEDTSQEGKGLTVFIFPTLSRYSKLAGLSRY
eukprot:3560375-Pyramimonas_sp.AAC.2